MKTVNNNNINANEESSKSGQSKNSKKSTKSRAKTTKSDINSKISSIPIIPTSIYAANTPTTPTTSSANYNLYEASYAGLGNSTETPSNSSKSHHKSYAGLEPRSVKTFWEQHDQTDLELSQEVCARVAEDATYKLWELINNVKTYARHSGGVVTYDLVNEVLKISDVPPALGAMDSDWERIDYDGSYFYYSDKILELRDEYQKEINVTIPHGPDFACSSPIEEKNVELIKKFIPNMLYATLYGDASTHETALTEVITNPLMGASYRAIILKIVQILAFKQHDTISVRCWRLLRACDLNEYVRNVYCREEYFHLAEIFISQLLGPYESIKVQIKLDEESASAKTATNEFIIKEEVDQFMEPPVEPIPCADGYSAEGTNTNDTEQITSLHLLDDDDEVEIHEAPQEISPYFASPVGATHVDELCLTIGQLAAQNGYLNGECLYLIQRRLERFFEGRVICSTRDFSFISRAVRGLLALGEYAFREFIPYIYKIKVDDIPDSLWQDLSVAAVFLNGKDDIFLYEWLAYGCGADKLQPFMVNSAQAMEKLLLNRGATQKRPAYNILSKLGVRRYDGSSVAAAKSLADESKKVDKPKLKIHDLFPDLIEPNLQLNRAGTIRFKFTGCRPALLKPKISAGTVTRGVTKSSSINGSSRGARHTDIHIARRYLGRGSAAQARGKKGVLKSTNLNKKENNAEKEQRRNAAAAYMRAYRARKRMQIGTPSGGAADPEETKKKKKKENADR